MLLFVVKALPAATPVQYSDHSTVKQSSEIHAQVGDTIQMVGELYRGVRIQTDAFTGEKAQFAFGNGRGFITASALHRLSQAESARYPIVRKATRPTNLNLITIKPVHIYSKADHKAPMIGWLAGNLRYP
ncbi:MAG: hypothetical protein ACRC5A_01775, partial [Enterobacteriaceae bacterium]